MCHCELVVVLMHPVLSWCTCFLSLLGAIHFGENKQGNGNPDVFSTTCLTVPCSFSVNQGIGWWMGWAEGQGRSGGIVVFCRIFKKACGLVTLDGLRSTRLNSLFRYCLNRLQFFFQLSDFVATISLDRWGKHPLYYIYCIECTNMLISQMGKLLVYRFLIHEYFTSYTWRFESQVHDHLQIFRS